MSQPKTSNAAVLAELKKITEQLVLLNESITAQVAPLVVVAQHVADVAAALTASQAAVGATETTLIEAIDLLRRKTAPTE
jgi:hypothetical protein